MNKKGRIIRTVCFPSYLSHIVDNLSEQRILSKTISDMLWDMYGDEDLDYEKAVINQMKSEAERLQKSIEAKEAELKIKDEFKELKARLNYIESWLSDKAITIRTLRQTKKKGHLHITDNNRDELQTIRNLVEQFDGVDKALEFMDEVRRERDYLKNCIANQTAYNNNNNNNNIYYLINYNNKDVSGGGLVL
jgi:hypothetical protein